MIDTDEAFRTSDMALAATLVMQGYTYRLEKIGPHEAVWVFEGERCSTEEFDDFVAKYEMRSVRVEPRLFIKYFTDVRRDLFALVPPDPRKGRSGRPGASAARTV